MSIIILSTIEYSFSFFYLVRTGRSLINEDKLTQLTTDDKDPSSCHTSATILNAGLLYGPKSGNFTKHSHLTTMDECKKKCCHLETCDVIYIIANVCYTVKCFTDDGCQWITQKRDVVTKLAYVTSTSNMQVNSGEIFQFFTLSLRKTDQFFTNFWSVILLLVRNSKDAFRTLSNIYDGTSFENSK